MHYPTEGNIGMNNHRVIGIGETVLDILFKEDQPQKAVPGGSTFNSIVSLGRAGVPCAMVTEVGGDHIGDIICRYLQDNGVSDEYVCRHEKVKSHISLAFLDEHNDARGGTAAERQPPLALQASQPHSLRHRRGRPASYGRRIKSTIAKNFLPSTMCPPEASLIGA